MFKVLTLGNELRDPKFAMGDVVKYLEAPALRNIKYKVVGITWIEGMQEFEYWIKSVRVCEHNIGHAVCEDELKRV